VAGQSVDLVVEGDTCTDEKADGGDLGDRADGNATSTYSLTAKDRFFLSAAGANGRRLSAKKVDVGPNAVKLDPSGSETIDGALDLDLTALAPKAMLVSDGANWRTI
jgi:hypothetical protein